MSGGGFLKIGKIHLKKIRLEFAALNKIPILQPLSNAGLNCFKEFQTIC
ncbi:hypothetical protein TEGAF0_24110 [Sediminibacterium sp. TEGAF015]|nr:hypothetical protein TEGAF0_24110 [Sediminibacterium sp. TEGAF015]